MRSVLRVISNYHQITDTFVNRAVTQWLILDSYSFQGMLVSRLQVRLGLVFQADVRFFSDCWEFTLISSCAVIENISLQGSWLSLRQLQAFCQRIIYTIALLLSGLFHFYPEACKLLRIKPHQNGLLSTDCPYPIV